MLEVLVNVVDGLRVNVVDSWAHVCLYLHRLCTLHVSV